MRFNSGRKGCRQIDSCPRAGGSSVDGFLEDLSGSGEVSAGKSLPPSKQMYDLPLHQVIEDVHSGRGRRLLYRLLNVNDWTETLLSGVPSPKRVRYG